MTNNEEFFITGTAYWTKIAEPNTNDKGVVEYTMDVSLETAAMKEKLQNLGVPIKNKDKELKAKGQTLQGDFVSLKSRYVPDMIDSEKNLLPEKTLIGNGSKVIVKTRPYEWSFKGKKGTSLGLNALQVLTLVPYKKRSLDGFESHSDGYKSSCGESTDLEDAQDEESPF